MIEIRPNQNAFKQFYLEIQILLFFEHMYYEGQNKKNNANLALIFYQAIVDSLIT